MLSLPQFHACLRSKEIRTKRVQCVAGCTARAAQRGCSCSRPLQIWNAGSPLAIMMAACWQAVTVTCCQCEQQRLMNVDECRCIAGCAAPNGQHGQAARGGRIRTERWGSSAQDAQVPQFRYGGDVRGSQNIYGTCTIWPASHYMVSLCCLMHACSRKDEASIPAGRTSATLILS